MKAPLCKVCGHEHWSNVPHVFGMEVVRDEKAVARGQPFDVKPGVASGKTRNRDRHAPGYMKNYMRRRRAKQGLR